MTAIFLKSKGGTEASLINFSGWATRRRMEMDGRHVTKRMLNLTLEIIYLLTGEKYIAFKLCDGLVISSLMETQNSVPRNNNKNIQKVTSEIIELLMGEVPIGCQDVTMRFSMEEEDCLEGHNDQHKDAMMEPQPTLPSSDGSSNRISAERYTGPLYSQDSSEEDRTMSQCCQHENVIDDMKAEIDEACVGDDEPCDEEEEEEISAEISTDTIETQIDVKAEEEEDEYLRIKEEEIPVEISTDGQYIISNPDMHPIMSPDGEIDEDDITPGSYEGSPVTPTIHPAPPSADPSCDPSTHGRRFPDQSRPLTLQTSHGGSDTFPCSECGKCFTQKAELITHQRNHEVERPYSCSECGKSFSSKSYLTKHQRLHTGEKRYTCSECGKRFQWLSSLRAHQRAHNECGKGFSHKMSVMLNQYNRTEEKTSRHPILSPDGETQDDDITSDSSEGTPTSVHLQPVPSSADPSTDPCTYGGSFSGHSSPATYRTAQRGDDTFPCSVCGKCFTQKAELLSHKRIHEGKKPYACSECGRSFSQKRYLARHQRLHTGEKPYSCSECGKSFPLKDYLISHQKVHRGERPHPCFDCGKSFARRSDLVIHQRTHTGKKPYSCSECGRCFPRRADLTIHLRTHTGERPFSCSECGKCFNQLGNLTSHQLTHTREKAYSCPECGKRFARKAEIYKHQKTHFQE